jgi:hypothetical protein
VGDPHGKLCAAGDLIVVLTRAFNRTVSGPLAWTR